jgi:hypothetical protein
MLSLQLHSKTPWLLLLTTRAGKGDIHAEVLNKVIDKYVQNLAECEDFHAASGEHFSITARSNLEAAIKTPEGLLAVFLIGICKWLVGLAVATNPQTDIEVKSLIGYRVANSSPCEDLVSVAFRFDPKLPAISDPLGLAIQSSRRLNECQLSTKAIRRVAKRVNADSILASNEILRREMTVSTGLLLEVARYEKNEYYKWVTETEGWQFS